MTTALPDEKRKWYYLALRHIRMALRLLHSGFADGAVFHIYHAYECVLSAFIASNNYAVPPSGMQMVKSSSGKSLKGYISPHGKTINDLSAHKARQIFFSELADQSKQYYQTHSNLSRFIVLTLILRKNSGFLFDNANTNHF